MFTLELGLAQIGSVIFGLIIAGLISDLLRATSADKSVPEESQTEDTNIL